MLFHAIPIRALIVSVAPKGDPMGNEIVEMYFAAINDRNVAAIRNMVCDDTEWSAPGGVVVRGPTRWSVFCLPTSRPSPTPGTS